MDQINGSKKEIHTFKWIKSFIYYTRSIMLWRSSLTFSDLIFRHTLVIIFKVFSWWWW